MLIPLPGKELNVAAHRRTAPDNLIRPVRGAVADNHPPERTNCLRVHRPDRPLDARLFVVSCGHQDVRTYALAHLVHPLIVASLDLRRVLDVPFPAVVGRHGVVDFALAGRPTCAIPWNVGLFHSLSLHSHRLKSLPLSASSNVPTRDSSPTMRCVSGSRAARVIQWLATS